MAEKSSYFRCFGVEYRDIVGVGIDRALNNMDIIVRCVAANLPFQNHIEVMSNDSVSLSLAHYHRAMYYLSREGDG